MTGEGTARTTSTDGDPKRRTRLDTLQGGLVVSCQPVPGGPMDEPGMVVGLARAALDGGAVGLRIESIAYVEAVRAAVDVPIIGLVKEDRDDTPVRITPTAQAARALAEAGADIVAFDATDRPRPDPLADIVRAIHDAGALAMADCASTSDMHGALTLGADCVGTTLSGYVSGPEPTEPDLELIAAARALTTYVVAEGRLRTPEQAAAALARGAFCVVVGSAITRPEHVASWFVEALRR